LILHDSRARQAIVDPVHLVRLVYLVQPNKRDKPNRPNEQDRLTPINTLGWPTIISPEAVGIAFLFPLIVAVFFGLYPANKASKMNPIEALHYE